MEALEMTLLYDYYGDLLTERQRSCLDLRYNQDMSLGEIAEELGVSRQGVHDNLSRAEEFLTRTEAVLGCVHHSAQIREAVDRLLKTAQILDANPDPSVSGLAEVIRQAVGILGE